MAGLDRVMVIVAHPDDAEFTCAGTIAKWVREGKHVVYVVCTSGDKGTSDPSMDPARLAQIREEEQLAAARALGVREVIFLRLPDGRLEDNLELREKLVRTIRQHRPDIVIAPDPYRLYQLHRDHRMVGWAAMDAVFPSARDPLNFPEHLRDGLQPHKVAELYLYGTDHPDVWIDISDTFDIKMEALRCHKSQVGHLEGLEERIREWARLTGQAKGLALAEAFKRIELRR